MKTDAAGFMAGGVFRNAADLNLLAEDVRGRKAVSRARRDAEKAWAKIRRKVEVVVRKKRGRL